MTFEEKKHQFIELFDEAAKGALRWEQSHGGSGSLRKIKRTIRMPDVYLSHFLARFGWQPPPVKVNMFWGYPVLLPSRGSDAFRIAQFGTLGNETEDKSTRFLIKTIQPFDIFYDIGASYGFYTYLASEFLEKGQVHAFEPLPHTFYFLEHNTRGKTRCICNNVALSDREGKIHFYKGYPSGVSSTMRQEVTRMNTWNRYQTIEVASTTLDTYLLHHQKPTLMKIDAEGAEHLIIKGALEFFSTSNPTIVMEVWGGEKGKQFSLPAVQELLALGYTPYAITPEGSLEKREPHSDTADNFVFRK